MKNEDTLVDNNNMPTEKQMPEGMPVVETRKEPFNIIYQKDSKVLAFKWLYIIIVAAVTIITILAFVGLSYQFSCQSEKIVQIHNKDSETLIEILNNPKSYNIRKESLIADMQELFEKHEAEDEALLELSFSKLQSDFNFISLWAGIITIVFLVFSIYSIFRTDEMLNQAQNATAKIEGLLGQAKSNFDDINNQTSETIIAYKQITQKEVEKLKTDIESLRKELENIEKIISPIEK